MKLNIEDLKDFDVRYEMFKRAVRFVDYELVDGDIYEFGVYSGRSLALLNAALEEGASSIHHVPFRRRVIGLDSFEGLEENEHPRWEKGKFKYNHSFHPLLEKGGLVTEQVVYDLFEAYDFEKPLILKGLFKDVLKEHKMGAASIVHIDCDLYEPTKEVLFSEGLFQTGTVLLFDDWFNFKSDPNNGEQKAFNEFLRVHDEWNAIEYFSYATFGKSFILRKTDNK
tara:strand:+ start:7160 stop:7834 length:675 start_codon:yes stop_codon:yes gene_type:complete